MRTFPALTTGAVSQYPITVRRNLRTIETNSDDGCSFRYFDVGMNRISWDLFYEALTLPETNALRDLFKQCNGQLESFCFLDPTANLLLWSSELENEAWTKDPLLTTTVMDPTGAPYEVVWGIGNSSSEVQHLAQTIAAPGECTYCFGLWAKSSSDCLMKLAISSGAVRDEKQFNVGQEWRAYEVCTNGDADADAVCFELWIEGGHSIEACGLMAEVGLTMSPYRDSTGRGGVFPNTRFDQDAIQFVATGPDAYSTRIKLTSRY